MRPSRRSAVAPRSTSSGGTGGGRSAGRGGDEGEDDKDKAAPGSPGCGWSGGGGLSGNVPPRLLSRGLCCAGLLILLQNLLLLRWGSLALQGCTLVSEVAPFAELPPPSGQGAFLRGVVADTVKSPSAAASTSSLVVGGALHARGASSPVSAAKASAAAAPRKPGARRSKKGHGRNGPPAKKRTSAPATTRKATLAPTPEPERRPSLDLVPAGSAAATGPMTPLSSLNDIPREKLRIFGSEVPSTVKYSIGFGSVKRKKDYILETVGTMLGLSGDMSKSILTAQEREMVVLVAHLSDFDMDWVRSVSNKLRTDYADLVSSGRFHVVHAPQEMYPLLEVCPPLCTYKDEPLRVKWRSKQNLDYAFLMHYSAPLAPYYLQIEDDLGFANNWVTKMDNYVKSHYPPTWRSKDNVPWRLIDFSQLGFIGKMFQADELSRMAQYLVLFYDQMPCDLLLSDWMQSMNQRKRIDYWRKQPSLFQHVGIFRTLGGFQPLQERKFGKLLFDNPQGQVGGNMTIVPTYEGKFAYFPGGEPQRRNDVCDFTKSPAHHKQKTHRCWFWGKEVHAGDHFQLTFAAPTGIPLKGVFLEQGHPKHEKDLFVKAEVQVAGPGCKNFFHLAPIEGSQTMIYWEEGVSNPPKLPVPKVKCLRIIALVDQEDWVAIQQVQVRTS
mmetsp:Transcript_313/g.1342  ORF Transcript_313/g.1342 Transcript_313/m.1342 type:complete len:665 (+) Transcript_313:200-2194(+)